MTDIRTDSLQVQRTLNVRKLAVANITKANDVLFRTLNVQNNITGTVITEEDSQIVVSNAQPPLAGSGRPSDPLTYLPPLLQPIAYFEGDEFDMYGNMTIGPLVYLEAVPGFGGWGGAKTLVPPSRDFIQRITVNNETSGLLFFTWVKDGPGPLAPLPITLTFLPIDPALAGPFPNFSIPLLSGTPTGLVITSTPFSGIVRYDFDTPIPAGTSFCLQANTTPIHQQFRGPDVGFALSAILTP